MLAQTNLNKHRNELKNVFRLKKTKNKTSATGSDLLSVLIWYCLFAGIFPIETYFLDD